MAGNQGHRHDWIGTFPFFWVPEVKAFAGAAKGFAPADGAVIVTRAVVTRDVEPILLSPATPRA